MPEPSPTPTTSLRERRRQETWAALHDAAATAFLEGTTEDCSVDAIATAAGVSPRTFFNYFGTKDEAVYGYRAPHLPVDALERLDPTGDPVEQGTTLLLETMRTATPHGSPARREELVAREPALGRFRLQALQAAEELVSEALVNAFRSEERLTASPQDAERTVRLWVALAAAVIRHAATDPARSPGTALDDTQLRHSLDLFHHQYRSTD